MAQRFYEPITRIFTNAGAVGVGYKYYFYLTGTTTPVTTYQNINLTVANTNPVISDSNGRLPEIWYSDLSQLKLIVKDSLDNTIETCDPVGATAEIASLNDFDVRPTSYWGLTTGTSTAYTLLANPTVISYNNAQTFVIQIHTDCGNNPTLSVDSLTAQNFKKYTQQGTKVNLKAGDLKANQRYFCTYDGVDVVVLNPNSLPILSGTSTALTISAGVVTLTNNSGSYIIDTEGTTASDDLDTINSGQDGQIIFLRLQNAARIINVRNAVGNIKIETGATITLNSTSQVLILRYDSNLANWIVIANNTKTLEILQIVTATTGAVAAAASDIPFDDTIPQIGEGTEFMSISITPKSATSLLRIDVVANWGQDVDENMTVALFKTGTADALASVSIFPSATLAYSGITSFNHLIRPSTLSTLTFTVRAGGNTGSGGTITLNGVMSARKLGGSMASRIIITEIQD
jgi:hypothetical protein